MIRINLSSDLILGTLIGAAAILIYNRYNTQIVEEETEVHLTASTELALEEEVDMSEWFEEEEEEVAREHERWYSESFGFGLN